MATSLVKLKVGFTTILALVILFGSMLWIKEFKPGVKTKSIDVIFSDSRGVSIGDPVTLSGVKVGKIKNISLTRENQALINFYVNSGVQINSDARFTIHEVGLMGDKALIVEPGKSNAPLDISRIQMGSDTPDYNDLLEKAELVMNQLNSATAKINNDVDLAKLSDAFEKTLVNVRGTLSAYRTIAEENRKTLAGSLKNAETASENITEFISENDEKIARAIDSFQRSSDRLGETFKALQPISVTMDTISAYMKSGDGTFAKLIKTDDLYRELRKTNATLDSFVTDFRLHPGKYTKDMKFKVRLF